MYNIHCIYCSLNLEIVPHLATLDLADLRLDLARLETESPSLLNVPFHKVTE